MIDTIESPYIHVAVADNFESMVLDNSHKGPVLVNFWSKKAGPCLRLYPVLDAVVHQYAGRVLLVNIDTGSEVVISKNYGISSVPTLKLFRHGQVVETLHGYQSEEDLKKILDQYVARDSDRQLAEAIRLYGEGRETGAYEVIATAIVDDPVNPRLPLGMCKLLKHEERYAEALKILNTLPDNIRDNREITRLRDLLGFCVEVDPLTDTATLQQQLAVEEKNISLRRQLVALYVLQQDHEAALQQLVEIMEREPDFEDNYAQKAMLRLFNILGAEHELSARFRPNLRRYTH